MRVGTTDAVPLDIQKNLDNWCVLLERLKINKTIYHLFSGNQIRGDVSSLNSLENFLCIP